jgi:hypothetical protein
MKNLNECSTYEEYAEKHAQAISALKSVAMSMRLRNILAQSNVMSLEELSSRYDSGEFEKGRKPKGFGVWFGEKTRKELSEILGKSQPLYKICRCCGTKLPI